MKIICRSAGIIGNLRPKQNIKDILAAGFEYSMLDAAVLCSPQEFKNLGINNYKREKGKVYLSENPEKLPEEMNKAFATSAKELGLHLPVAMAPTVAAETIHSKKTDIGKVNDTLKLLAKETLKLAIAEKCESIIVPPIYLGLSPKEEWEVNSSFYQELSKIADDAGSDIRILLKNMTKDINGHFVRGICAEAEEAVKWIDELNAKAGKKDRFGFCFDVGNATLCGQDLKEVIVPLGERLQAVIVRDLDGVHDAALLPYTACFKGQQTNWLSMIRGLRQIHFDGAFIMDFADTYGNMTDMIRPSILSLAHEIAEHFAWHIGMDKLVKKHDKRVLFGAGNMCRAYMKDYGKEYKPLFTCDNNSARWGEEFCGLTIESPEKLKELSPDTAIYICNVYYKEISAQLKEMGLKNPIEWFSDEYCDTFYMDRLDMAADPNAAKGGKS